MRKTKIDKRSLMRSATLVLFIVFLISVSILFLQIWEKNQGIFSTVVIDGDTLKYQGKEYGLKKNVETFLVMGLDKFEGHITHDSYNNDQQADFLMLFVFDNDAKTCSALQIDRDTMVDMNVLGVAGNRVDTVNGQIALAHTYGNGREVSCRNTADAVSDLLLGMKVNHYLSLTLDSVAIINDLAGGVELTVLDDFSGVDDSLVKGETVTLMGEQALHYVRSRMGMEDSSNRARMARQRQYVEALYEKMKQRMEADDSFAVDVSLAMADYIVSDRSVTQLQTLSRKFSEYEFVKLDDIQGESKAGEEFMEFHADKNSVRDLVVELFFQPSD